MTEKRFTIKEFSTLDAMASMDVICDNGIELPTSTACDLLNEQHKEIQRLKFSLQNTSAQKNEFYRGARENANCVGKLKEENEQLKLEINMLKTTIARNEAYIKRLTQTSEWRTSAYD